MSPDDLLGRICLKTQSLKKKKSANPQSISGATLLFCAFLEGALSQVKLM